MAGSPDPDTGSDRRSQRQTAAGVFRLTGDPRSSRPHAGRTAWRGEFDLLHVADDGCLPSLGLSQAAAAGAELELGFNDLLAKTEADRCLQCGLICYQKSGTVIRTIQPVEDGPVEPPRPADADLVTDESSVTVDISRIH